ncbi:MAG: hypothetical protein JW725_02655 [Candidatus Babeliaceae bacterium]|nr:hypothetical protein [Candidatus Babeliaceae bacterium]
MTVVIGFNWLTEVVMLADSRISWEDHQHPPQDILQKLYRFGDSNNSVVLGFCGDLLAARKVIFFLVASKLRKYKRPFVVSQFGDELVRWIEQAARSELTPKQRTNIKFMLCGIEPSRHPPILKDGKIIGHTSFVEAHIYIYTISKNGKVDCDKRPKWCAVIGTGNELECAITNKLEEARKFGSNEPQLHWARAIVGGEAIAQVIAESERVSVTVGGPFQVVRITTKGLETHYIWPWDIENRNVEVQDDNSKIVLSNPSIKEKYILYPIWELPLHDLRGAG